jgi:hypothetical protein
VVWPGLTAGIGRPWPGWLLYFGAVLRIYVLDSAVRTPHISLVWGSSARLPQGPPLRGGKRPGWGSRMLALLLGAAVVVVVLVGATTATHQMDAPIESNGRAHRGSDE